jgi:hypothetical protein
MEIYKAIEEDVKGRGRNKGKELKLERKACIKTKRRAYIEAKRRTCIGIERKKKEKKCL